jgi:hypothetical protein
MTDTTTNETAKKKQIAERHWINAAGEKVPTGSQDVIGVRYTYLPSGKSVEYRLDDSALTRQFAAMGAVTKIGNVVNSIVNADDFDGNHDAVMDGVEEWLTSAINGEWREPSEGAARGPKYDKDLLAECIVAELAGKPGVATKDEYRTRLEDRSYYAKVRNNPPVMARYMQAVASKAGAADAGGLI